MCVCIYMITSIKSQSNKVNVNELTNHICRVRYTMHDLFTQDMHVYPSICI